MKKYRMPNGRTYQFADADVPAGAVLAEAVKAEPETEEKAMTKTVAPANKARKVSKK